MKLVVERAVKVTGKMGTGKLLKINMRRRASKCFKISLSFWSADCLFDKWGRILYKL